MKTSLVEQDILDLIENETVSKLGAKTTVVVLTLKNGFEVVGTSACVDPDNYNHEIGAKYARQRAIDKVWELEGYVLQKQIAESKTEDNLGESRIAAVEGDIKTV